MSITPESVQSNTWAACHYCPYAVPLDQAVRVDIKQTPHGEHWAWAHPDCAEVRRQKGAVVNPCMSCGADRADPAEDRCLHKANHVGGYVTALREARAEVADLRLALEREQELADRRAGEVERLRNAIASHANMLDVAALGEGDGIDRDDIDNDLYNVARSINPAWWDENVPALWRSIGSTGEELS